MCGSASTQESRQGCGLEAGVCSLCLILEGGHSFQWIEQSSLHHHTSPHCMLAQVQLLENSFPEDLSLSVNADAVRGRESGVTRDKTHGTFALVAASDASFAVAEHVEQSRARHGKGLLFAAMRIWRKFA